MKKYFVLVAFLLGFGSAAQAASTYEVDATHSSLMFSVDYLVISKTTGKFTDFAGTLTWDENDLSKCQIQGAIQAQSITTDNEKRDTHLKSEDFFWVEKYPEIQFATTQIAKDGDGYKATGQLTLRGVTKTVAIPFKVTGKIKDFAGNERIGLSGSFVINRKDYGINWNKALDAGGAVVSDNVTIQLDMQVVQKAAP